MKSRFIQTLTLAVLPLIPAFAQPQPPQQPQNPPPLAIPVRALNLPGGKLAEPARLTTFNLDFPGGTPQQLVAAIEKAMGKPLNAIIPVEHGDVELPPLKMNNVDVSQLFQALEITSVKTEAYLGGSGYQQMRTSYGFRMTGERSDDSIWSFYVEKPSVRPAAAPIPKICRFYPLSSYLERGISVDDVTTAIQTGWKMLGEKETPVISFHKETKLLIAVGEPAKLETIDAVLKALAQSPKDNYTERLQTIIQNAAPGNMPRPARKDAEPPKAEN